MCKPIRHGLTVRSAPLLALALLAASGALARAQTAPAPVPAGPPGGLGLPELLAHAEQHSPLLREARARLALGEAAVAGVQGALREHPELELGAGPRMASGRAPSADFQARLQQRVELSGQAGQRHATARSVVAVENERLAAARFALRAGVRAAFYELWLARERERAARDAEQVQTRIVEIARGRLQAGDIGPLDARLTEADLAQVVQARMAAEGQATLAALQLAELAGLPSGGPPVLAGEPPLPSGLPQAEALLAQARKTQPARRVALAALREREERRRLAEREGWAGPAFGLAFSHEDRSQNVLLATVSLPLPLFSVNRAERAGTRAERSLAQAEIEAADQALPLRIRSLLAAVETASRRIATIRRDLLPRVQENLALVGRAFELGELDALQVSAARTRLLDAQRTGHDAYRDYVGALAELELQTGAELTLAAAP